MIFDFIFVYFLPLLNEAHWPLETQAHTACLGAHKGPLSPGMCSSATQEVLGFMFETWLRFPNGC